MPPRDKDGNYTEFEPKIMFRDPETGDVFDFQATALDDGLTLPGTEPVVKVPPEDEEAEFTLKLRRMSRKRFIKLLMSHSYPRNCARAWAEAARLDHIPYNNAYFLIRIQEGLIPC